MKRRRRKETLFSLLSLVSFTIERGDADRVDILETWSTFGGI
jgi:hypothetical protein